MRKGIIVLACALASVLLFGCSTSTPAEKPEPTTSKPATAETSQEEPIDLEILESGWYAGESGYVHYGVGVKNPNQKYEANNFTLTITGKDDAGKIIFTDDQVMSFVLPGGEYYFGSQAGNGTAPASVDFTVSVPKNRGWIANDRQSFEIYTVENPNEVPSSYNTSFTGEVTANDEWNDVGSAWMSVILRDDGGKIIGGHNSFAKISSEGQTVPFEVTAYDPIQHASFDIYAVPWF